MDRVIIEGLTESKTFKIKINGRRFGFSKSSSTINGKKVVIAQWKLDGEVVLEIRTNIPGTWRILQDGRKGYAYISENPSDKQCIVLLVK